MGRNFGNKNIEAINVVIENQKSESTKKDPAEYLYEKQLCASALKRSMLC